MVKYQEHHLEGGGNPAIGFAGPRRSLFPAKG